jgi:hypothetical protein
MRKIPGLVTAVGGTLGLALAMTSAPSTASAAPLARCFWVRNVDSFASVDNRTVYVRANMRNVFELKLFAPCINVNWAHHVALRSRANSLVCEGTGHDLEIFYRWGVHSQRCPVTNVRRLSPAEVAALPPLARP